MSLKRMLANLEDSQVVDYGRKEGKFAAECHAKDPHVSHDPSDEVVSHSAWWYWMNFAEREGLDSIPRATAEASRLQIIQTLFCASFGRSYERRRRDLYDLGLS